MTDTTASPALALPRLGRVNIVESLGSRLHFGSVALTARDGRRYEFVGREPGPAAALTISGKGFGRRLLTGGALGFAEAYIDGIWDSPDLATLIELGARNVDAAWGSRLEGHPLPRLVARLHHLVRPNRSVDPGNRLRLGRLRRIRRRRTRLPRYRADDLRRPVCLRPQADRRSRPRRQGRDTQARLSRPRRAIRPGGLDRDARGGRRALLAALFRTARLPADAGRPGGAGARATPMAPITRARWNAGRNRSWRSGTLSPRSASATVSGGFGPIT